MALFERWYFDVLSFESPVQDDTDAKKSWPIVDPERLVEERIN